MNLAFSFDLVCDRSKLLAFVVLYSRCLLISRQRHSYIEVEPSFHTKYQAPPAGHGEKYAGLVCGKPSAYQTVRIYNVL